MCSPGFIAGSGAPVCSRCTGNSYSATQGATACAVCPIELRVDPLQGTSCLACASGSYRIVSSNASAEPCPFCPAGTFSISPASICSHCEIGTYARAASSVCLVCDETFTPTSDQSGCTDTFTVTKFTFFLCLVIIGACALIIVIILILMLVLRKARSIAMSSPPFLIMMLIGSLLLCASSYLLVSTQTPLFCTLKFWLIHMGIDAIFTSIFAKVCTCCFLVVEIFLELYSSHYNLCCLYVYAFILLFRRGEYIAFSITNCYNLCK